MPIVKIYHVMRTNMNVLPIISGSNNCNYFKIFNCRISFKVSPDMKISQVANHN